MIHTVDPRQNRLFDPFQGVIPPSGQQIIADGWQGVFRHALLEVMPVGDLAENFSRDLGAPTKELYSMASLVFLADFFGWTAQAAVDTQLSRSRSRPPNSRGTERRQQKQAPNFRAAERRRTEAAARILRNQPSFGR
jgi:hypothetical protein